MKTLFFLLLLGSCALFDEVSQNGINWLGDADHPSVKRTREPNPPEVSVPQEKATHILIPSTQIPAKNKAATLMYNPEQVIINLTKGKVTYREGHSIELKADDVPFILQVLPSNPASAQSVQIKDPVKFLREVKGKKTLQVELILDETGPTVYEFDLTELNHAL